VAWRCNRTRRLWCARFANLRSPARHRLFNDAGYPGGGGLGGGYPLTENLQNFINRVGAERTMFETKMPVLGGSQTAARLVEEAEGSASSNPAWNMTVGASERRCGLRRRSVIR